MIPHQSFFFLLSSQVHILYLTSVFFIYSLIPSSLPHSFSHSFSFTHTSVPPTRPLLPLQLHFICCRSSRVAPLNDSVQPVVGVWVLLIMPVSLWGRSTGKLDLKTCEPWPHIIPPDGGLTDPIKPPNGFSSLMVALRANMLDFNSPLQMYKNLISLFIWGWLVFKGFQGLKKFHLSKKKKPILRTSLIIRLLSENLCFF